MQTLKRILLFPLDALVYLMSLVPDIHLGKPFGIPLTITRAFIVWLACLIWLGGWELGVILAIAYFFVTIHEYAHALVAKRLGYETLSIKLWPMSGLATIKGDWSEHYKHEFWIALAGPLSNIVLAILLYPFARFGNFWVVEAFEINVYLALFNMVPIAPMDGGRVFHSFLLSKLKDMVRTARATIIFTILAAVIFVPALYFYYNPIAAMLVSFMVLAGIAEQKNTIERASILDELKSATQRLVEIVERAVGVEKQYRPDFCPELDVKLLEVKRLFGEGKYQEVKDTCEEIMFQIMQPVSQ